MKAIEECRQAEHDIAAKEFRSLLRSQGLLPPEYDDFGNLLRYAMAGFAGIEVGSFFGFLSAITKLRLPE